MQYGNVVFGSNAMTAEVGIEGTAGDFSNLMLTAPNQWGNNTSGTSQQSNNAMIETVTVPNGVIFNWHP